VGSSHEHGGQSNAAAQNQPPRALLSPGASVTLSGPPTAGGPLVLSVGAPGPLLGTGVETSAAADESTLPDRPAYVAPDSNAVTSADRALVRGYFSPRGADGH
jgi:hypothetical protein